MNPTTKWSEPEVPNYGESLDAMAEAEATLTERELVEYANSSLYLVVTSINGMMNSCAVEHAKVITATASQRLDAFLLAKGLAE